MGELVIAPVDLTEPKTSHKGFINGLEITLHCTGYIFCQIMEEIFPNLACFWRKMLSLGKPK